MSGPLEPRVPPAGEELHLPGPSLLPVLLAVGFTFALIGITISWILTIAGGLLTLAVLVRWVRSAAAEMDELPLETTRSPAEH